MTIQRAGAYRYLECEDCAETFGEDDDLSFDELIEKAKAARWSIKPAGTAWEHRCPGCAQSSRLESQMRKFGR